ncbi:glutathione S-transferase [Sporothrix schenckii 1099-18]|uniref:Glutathione S-transferase n=1 Tax=Sporothrix schenckii 1099-18 TaxID=1397361 RepID=A0A0F2M7B6_SPOSC|nr:glutathione S-transferase [Sporothrix schenckii 1099-18]KJR84959.1 glutathione S-transferase [Sporothrix schenckii 1099-18]
MSAAPATKRQKASTPDEPAPYTLIYWPGLPGRGEHVRLAFEEAGVPYVDVSKQDDAIPQVLARISPDNAVAVSAPNLPPLAPPILQHGDLTIHQTPNILMYLGPRLGLVPTAEDNDGNAVYRVNALALTALDGFSNEVHDCHHPICTSLYYEDQKAESVRKSKLYVKNRLPKFLAYFERVLHLQEDRKAGGPWLCGAALTYADLVLFQSLDGTAHQFPRALQQLRDAGDYKRVFALTDAVRARPNIAAYLASDRRAKYGDGIYRYYKELDVLPEDSVDEKE